MAGGGLRSLIASWLGGGASRSNTGSGGCSFSMSMGATGKLGYVGVGTMAFAMAISGASSQSVAATGNVGFTHSVQASGNTSATTTGPRSLLGFWLGGIASPGSTASGALEFSFSMSADGTHRGFGIRSSLAPWIGGAATGPLSFTGSGGLTFSQSVAATGTTEGGSNIDGSGDLSFAPALSVTAIETIKGQGQCSVLLVWDPNSEIDIAGYRIYYSTTPAGTKILLVDVGNVTSYTVSSLLPGVYYFVVAPYNTGGEQGPYSNQITGDLSGLGFTFSIDAQSLPGYIGSGNLSFAFSQEASGLEKLSGSGSLEFLPEISATAKQSNIGAADLAFGPSISATAQSSFKGQGSLGFSFSMDGTGAEVFRATGNLGMPGFSFYNTALYSISASGNVGFLCGISAAGQASHITAHGSMSFDVPAIDGVGVCGTGGTGAIEFLFEISCTGFAIPIVSGMGSVSFECSIGADGQIANPAIDLTKVRKAPARIYVHKVHAANYEHDAEGRAYSHKAEEDL